MSKYRGITYPRIMGNRFVRWFFRRFMCPREIHMFDECWSLDDHCLVCDACDLSVHIARFEEYKPEEDEK